MQQSATLLEHDAFELRLMDDEAKKPTPLFEVGALDGKERISCSEQKELAIVVKKGYKNVKSGAAKDEDAIDPKVAEALRKEGKRMLTVQVNTSLLKTKFQIVINESEMARQILKEVALKLKDKIYENPKMFCIVPVLGKGEQKAQGFTLAKYGGKPTDFMELMFNNQQSSGMFDYDGANYIDLNAFIKNLKCNVVEVTEKVYVDMPMRKQKEVPIERKQDIAMTLQQSNFLGKINFNKELY